MIKSNKAKHKPFRTVEVPSTYFIRDDQIFNELFPNKIHPEYGSNKDIQICLFSEFDKKIALLMYPDWKNIIVYTNRQINISEGKQVINIYLFDNNAIESFEHHEKKSELKNITLRKGHIFTDEQLGKNKGSLVILKNGEVHLFQNNREKNEYIEEFQDSFVLDNIRYYKLGERYLIDAPNLSFHSSTEYVKKFQHQTINIFKTENDLNNYLNNSNNIKNESSKYNSISLFDVKDNGVLSQLYYFINQHSFHFECGFRYPVVINNKTNAWIVKKSVELGLLKSEVLFLFETDKNILDIPIKE